MALLLHFYLSPSTGLTAWADRKISFLQAEHWSHNLPNCDFDCQHKFYAPALSWVGENLARGSGPDWCTKDAVYRHWRESPPHKRILDEQQVTTEVFKMSQYKGMCYSVLERAK